MSKDLIKFLDPAETVAAMARDLLARRDFLNSCEHCHETALLVNKLKGVNQ